MFIKPGLELKAGDEIFINYGYKKKVANFPADFPWYFNLEAKVEEERRIKKIMKKREGKKNKNKSSKKGKKVRK